MPSVGLMGVLKQNVDRNVDSEHGAIEVSEGTRGFGNWFILSKKSGHIFLQFLKLG